jgi:hypothetical protein
MLDFVSVVCIRLNREHTPLALTLGRVVSEGLKVLDTSALIKAQLPLSKSILKGVVLQPILSTKRKSKQSAQPFPQVGTESKMLVRNNSAK